MNQLNASHLAKSYHGRQVVNDVSLRVHAGEIVGLLGPNGAGKTTSFYMIVGLVNADKGRIHLNERNITHLPLHQRAQMGLGYLPQEPSIFRKMTVSDNIMAILQLRDDLTHKQRLQKLESLLQEFHISHVKNSMGISLSGGERRRTEIARTLAMEPKFILLDEPFAGIDPISIIDIKRIIIHLRDQGIGVLITDHNVREALGICQRASVINEGSVIAEGSPQDILNNQQVRDVYLGHEFDL